LFQFAWLHVKDHLLYVRKSPCFQALIDCSWGYGNNGCDGGEDFRSYQWMLKHGGIPLEDEYGGYLGQVCSCSSFNQKFFANEIQRFNYGGYLGM
jgi:hypothetical protein